jgi:putative inorganic carbon (HCO3(-)) transporter
MRDLIMFCIVFGLLPFILRRPVIGICLFTWISLMNPHRLSYGPAYDFPFAALVAIVTIVSLFLKNQPKRFPFTPTTAALMIFIAWTTLTTVFALEQELAWAEWNRVSKTFLMVLVSMLVLRSKEDIKLFVWVTGLSLGFYGLKGGIFTLATGGHYRVMGPERSYIADNNDLALALVTTLPIVWYLRLQAKNKLMRRGLTALTFTTLAAAVGSYSRGALLAGGAMLFFLWLKGRHKLQAAFLLILILPILLLTMPETWFARMSSIEEYRQDASALGRINAWYFALNLATEKFLGGGFKVFTPRMFLVYGPDPLDPHAPHSIYFQVLGEHGFIGLTIFLFFMFFGWRSGTRLIKFCKGNPDLQWARDLAAMCQVSIVGYAVGGAFLSLAYYDLYYNVVTILVVLEKLLLYHSKYPENNPGAAPILQAVKSRGVDQ